MRYLWVPLLVATSGCAAFVPRVAENPWAKATASVTAEPAEAIGSYSAGCLAGGTSLPPDGAGYQIVRISRRRYYGHPSLTSYVQKLGSRVAEAKLGVLMVGDMSQPRGGPAPSGHKSHQTGLDVDIWLGEPKEANGGRSLTLDERESVSARSMVLEAQNLIDREAWSERTARMLELAASLPDVERIFVHPTIKRELCDLHRGNGWLGKIRPWWGHTHHFHVRLKCPEGNAQCASQDPFAPGDGCDSTLEWWFSAEAAALAAEASKEPPAPAALPKLPDACDAILVR